MTISPSVLPLLTLDAFAGIMQVDPCWIMGVKLNGSCQPLETLKRDQIARAVQTALDMFEVQLGRTGRSLYSYTSVLKAGASYFDLTAYSPQAVTVCDVAATIATPVNTDGLFCASVVAVTANIGALDPLLCETFLDAELVFPGCIAKRLGVEWCAPPDLADDGTLTLYAHAANFIDIDHLASHADEGVTFLDEAILRVRIAAPSQPKAHWPKTCGCAPVTIIDCQNPCCQRDVTTGCLREGRHGLFDVRDFNTAGHCGAPDLFSLNVLRKGAWMPHWADAIISLANCLMPADTGICECSPLANERWRDDNGVGEKWDKTYRYSFWNPFGIAAPGAQKAYKAIEAVAGETAAWNM